MRTDAAEALFLAAQLSSATEPGPMVYSALRTFLEIRNRLSPS